MAAKQSLMAKNLTPEVKEKLENVKTKFGGDLAISIKSVVECPDSSQGIYACDPDAYVTFADLFLPIIAQSHKVLGDVKHPEHYFGDPDHPDFDLASYDPTNSIISTRARVARSLAGYPFAVNISCKDRLEVENKIETTLNDLPDHHKGKYLHLGDIPDAERERLINEHVLYKKGDKYLEAAECYRDWPSGRGIFISNDGNFHVWVNEEDHMRIVSLAKGSNLSRVYKTLIETVETLNKEMAFAHNPQLGYLSVCPSNLGTGLRASVLVALPKVSQLKNFKLFCAETGIDVRGTHGEHTEAEGGVYDISNKRRLGLTAFEALQQMARGIRILLLLEQSL